MISATNNESGPDQIIASNLRFINLIHPGSAENESPVENTLFWQPTQLFGIKLVLNGAVLARQRVLNHEILKEWVRGGEFYVHLSDPASGDSQTANSPSTFEEVEEQISFFETNRDSHVLCMPAGMEYKQRLLLHRIRMLLQDQSNPQLMFPVLPQLHGKSVLRLPAIRNINAMREYFFPSEHFFIAETSLFKRLISETNRQVLKMIANKHSLAGAELNGMELLLLLLIDEKMGGRANLPKITSPISMIGFSDFWYTHVYAKGLQKHSQSPQTNPVTRKKIIDIFCDELLITADEYAEIFSRTEAVSANDF